MSGAESNVVALNPPPPTDEPKSVQFELEKDDIIRLFTGTVAPFAPASTLVSMRPDLLRATETPEWNVEALKALPMQRLLELYAEINWAKTNPLGGVVVLMPAK